MPKSDDKRDEYIKIYVSDYEKKTIERKADEESMSVSTYGRRKILKENKE